MDTCQIKVFGVNQVLKDDGKLSNTFTHSFPRCPSWVGILEFSSLNAIWKDLICECISVKIKSWIAESDFSFHGAGVPQNPRHAYKR